MVDRRKHARVPFARSLVMSWPGGKVPTVSTDLSFAGVCVRSDLVLGIGTEVSLRIPVEGSEGVSASAPHVDRRGRVVWERANQKGIAFTDQPA